MLQGKEKEVQGVPQVHGESRRPGLPAWCSLNGGDQRRRPGAEGRRMLREPGRWMRDAEMDGNPAYEKREMSQGGNMTVS